MQSVGGVQQSYPLGPLLFSAALQSLAQDLRGQWLDLAFFYLDDGVIAGDVHAVVRAPALPARATSRPCSGPAAQPLLSESAVPLEMLRGPDGASRFQRSLDLLGAAVGAHTNARVEAAAPPLDALAQLEDAPVPVTLA